MMLYECVRRIIGQIEPTGDSGIDKVRLANFQEQCKVTLDLMHDIVFISQGYQSSQEASVRKINELALNTVKEFKEVLGGES